MPVTPSGIAHFGFKVEDNNFDRAMDTCVIKASR
jgi:hypothetical protein